MIDITKNILNLTDEEKHRFFKIITENHDIFDKLIPKTTLVSLAKNGDVPHDGPLLQTYRDWRANQPD